MCGIAGLFDYRSGPESGAPRDGLLEAMVRVLRHRGPDEERVHREGPLGLAHARLSILDLEGGSQPLFSEDGQIAVIANGEIYNYRELTTWLAGRGHRFRSRSDCEVIVHLYEELGEACVESLRGMFAFAVADLRQRRLLLARDRLGKKPLYYTDSGGRLAFASELKALLAAHLIEPEIDPEALDLYLTYGYVPAPWSIFRGARKLPAGHLAVCNERGLRIRRYWDVDFEPRDEPPSAEGDRRWTERVEGLLSEAVKVRLMSDVPLGAFLSGGLDSGIVVSLMSETLASRVETHTVGFDDPTLDERQDAEAVAAALGVDHRASMVEAHLIEILPRIAWHLDEPFSDPSALPSWYLARETRRRVTVALSGDGGDELFAGYPGRYGLHLMEHRIRPWLPGALRRWMLPALGRRWPRSPRLPRFLRAGSVLTNLAVDAPRAYFQDRHLIPELLQDRLFGPRLQERRRHFDPFVVVEQHLDRAPANDPLARILYLDLKTWLVDDNLVKVDRMSMAHSLEVRCPLLDQQIVELAGQVPSRLKLAGGRTKIVLREIAARRLPPQILQRPKRGFAPPVSRWMARDLADHTRDLLLDPGALAAELFDRRQLEGLLDAHRGGRLDAGWPLWTLLMLEVWRAAVRDGEGAPVRSAAPPVMEVARAAGG